MIYSGVVAQDSRTWLQSQIYCCVCIVIIFWLMSVWVFQNVYLQHWPFRQIFNEDVLVPSPHGLCDYVPIPWWEWTKMEETWISPQLLQNHDENERDVHNVRVWAAIHIYIYIYIYNILSLCISVHRLLNKNVILKMLQNCTCRWCYKNVDAQFTMQVSVLYITLFTI